MHVEQSNDACRVVSNDACRASSQDMLTCPWLNKEQQTVNINTLSVFSQDMLTYPWPQLLAPST